MKPNINTVADMAENSCAVRLNAVAVSCVCHKSVDAHPKYIRNGKNIITARAMCPFFDLIAIQNEIENGTNQTMNMHQSQRIMFRNLINVLQL